MLTGTTFRLRSSPAPVARTLKNSEIAAAFEELATLYELDGAVVYRVVAYRTAAKSIRESGVSVADMAAKGAAQELSGIGKTIAEKITALVESGSIPAADKLKARIPAGLVQITNIPGLGPKRTRLLHAQLGIESLEDLRQAVEDQRLRTVPGFGAKAEEKVLAALAGGADGLPRTRTLLSSALTLGEDLVEGLRAHEASLRVELAGSARRWGETCKDLDIVAAAADPAALVEAFTRLPGIDEVTTSGEAGARALTHQGLVVDLRIVGEESFGNLLQHFTGSASHNEALRTKAVKRGLHVSEYAVTDDATGDVHRCATEEEVYELLGMAYVEPELRENRGELEAARKGELPELLRLADIRGDLHSHTTASDGRNSIEQMARAAQERGYEYLAITDHSATHGFGNHVTPDELKRQIERIREVDAGMEGFRVLAGTETNVLPDGSVDYEDDLLGELDWVVASVHTSFGITEEEMTDRMVAAIEHPLVDVIGHPTGRLIGRREPYAVDLGRVIEAAARTHTFLEINANPNRRDLDDVHARVAARAGVRILIDSDAHGTETLGNMRYGVATARRAWLSAADVANTRSWDELRALRPRG
ncbi:MAG: DNA polymerase/3'-5' exonuclease PolX [Actinomycetota bacterium]|nr:DNA polymerase/3'-5' exonuclease PolX [Actinomycetota bacterium]